jgi:hypothetical protein
MGFNFEDLELSPDAARQYIDASAAFTALERAQAEVQQVRGGMVWSSDGKYLVRTSPTGAQKSLGPRSPHTEALHAAFQQRKERAQSRLHSLKDAVAQHERLNKALRVGRVPRIAVQILQRLASAGLAEHFRVVGTHALYAYETEAGVRLPSSVTTTLDIDLLWDVRRRVAFVARLQRAEVPSMLGLLRKVDASFELDPMQRYTAVNDKGFQVDILRREAQEDDPHPVRLSDDEDDFWVVQARRANELMNAPPFSTVVVADTGQMARLHTLHPAAFVDFKRWMANLPERAALKRRRDALQAEAVTQLLQERLSQWGTG